MSPVPFNETFSYFIVNYYYCNIKYKTILMIIIKISSYITNNNIINKYNMHRNFYIKQKKVNGQSIFLIEYSINKEGFIKAFNN